MRPIVALALLLSAVSVSAERLDMSARFTLGVGSIDPTTLVRSKPITLEYFMFTFDFSSTACDDLTMYFKVDGTTRGVMFRTRWGVSATQMRWVLDNTKVSAYSEVELVLDNSASTDKSPVSCTVQSIYVEFTYITTPAPLTPAPLTTAPLTPAPWTPSPWTRPPPVVYTNHDQVRRPDDDSPNVGMIVGLIVGALVVIIIVIVVVCVCVKRRKTGKTNEDVTVQDEELMPASDYHSPQSSD